ncbi:MAG TPA: hypothetical protein VFG14_02355 [Chthoniobacteraceae bacterium]|jgi:hypothetical protein|nr:hypothetical protein [Chthoniobacteraceae bacterium]
MNDTPPEISAMVRSRLMTLPGATRLKMGAQMFEAARSMICASLPRDISAQEKRRLLFERIYGEPFPASNQ